MVNIISQNGYFFREIPFTTANAEAIRTEAKRGLALYETGQNVRFLATDILNVDYPIALSKIETQSPYKEFIKKCSPEGIDEDGMKVKLFIPTTFNAYENFRPTAYQACLIWVDNQEWRIAVCRGYNEKNNEPHFFGYASTYKSIPLCIATKGLLNEAHLSWKDYIAQQLERK